MRVKWVCDNTERPRLTLRSVPGTGANSSSRFNYIQALHWELVYSPVSQNFRHGIHFLVALRYTFSSFIMRITKQNRRKTNSIFSFVSFAFVLLRTPQTCFNVKFIDAYRIWQCTKANSPEKKAKIIRKWCEQLIIVHDNVHRIYLGQSFVGSSLLFSQQKVNVTSIVKFEFIFFVVVWIQRRHRFVRFSRHFLESHIRCDAACKWARISSNDLLRIHRSVDGIFTHYCNTYTAFMLPLRIIDAALTHTHKHMGHAARPYSPSHVGVAAKATTTITTNAELDKLTSIIPFAKTLSAQETFIQSSVAIQTSRKISSLCSQNKIS